MLRFAVLIIFGILLGVLTPMSQLPLLPMGIVVVIFMLVALFLRSSLLQTVVTYITVILAGILLSVYSISNMEQHVGEKGVELLIASQPRLSKSGKVYLADARMKDDSKILLFFPGKVKEKPVEMGEQIFADATIESVSDNRWSMSQGYVGKMFLLPNSWHTVTSSSLHVSFLTRMKMGMQNMRDKLLQSVDRNSMGDDAYAVFAAMSLGDKHAVSTELREVYSRTGASHVLALSGMHIAILYAFLMFLLYKTYARIAIICIKILQRNAENNIAMYFLDKRPDFLTMRFFFSVIALLLLWLYAFLVGMSSSVVRAVTMLSLYTLVSIFGHERDSLNVLSITVVLMLVVSPLSLFDVGFQMSFLAVLGIILCYVPVSTIYVEHAWNHWLWGNRVVKWFIFAILLSLSAQALVLPLVVYNFGVFPVYSVLSSLLVSITSFFIVALSITVYVFPPLTPFFAYIVDFQNNSLAWIASLPGSSIDNISINVIQVVLLYVMIFSIIIIARIVYFKAK